MANLRNLRQPIEKFRGIRIAHNIHPKIKKKKSLVTEASKTT